MNAFTDPEETEPVDDDTISLARRVRALEDAAGAVIPRWDADPLILAQGWVGGRCGKCGESLPAPGPVSAPVSTEDTDDLMDMDGSDQPDGIDEQTNNLPDPATAAERITAYVSNWGDGRIDRCGGQSLYARDLEAVTRGLANWSQAAQLAGDHCRGVEQERDRLRGEIIGMKRALHGVLDVEDPDSYLPSWQAMVERVADLVTGGVEAHVEVDRLRGVVRDYHAQVLATAEQLGRESDRRADEEPAAPVSSVEPEQDEPPFKPGDRARRKDGTVFNVGRVARSGAGWKVYDADTVFAFYAWASDLEPAVPEQAQPRPQCVFSPTCVGGCQTGTCQVLVRAAFLEGVNTPLCGETVRESGYCDDGHRPEPGSISHHHAVEAPAGQDGGDRG